MSSILLTAPAVEPLTLEEAKAFVRVEHNDDDAAITALIAAARLHVEAQTRRALVTQGWRLLRDRWPDCGRIDIRPAPLQALDAVRVYDADGNAHSVDLQNFVLDRGAAAVAFMPFAVTAPGRVAAGIELDITAGYGDAASDVPEPLRQAVRLLTAHWYDNRDLATTAAVPAGLAALLAPYRMVAL